MAGSTLTGFNYIPENSEATPGLWNSVFSVLSQNIAEANAVSGIVSNISTVGMVTINANSNVTNYLFLNDSSAQRSDYIIGSQAGGTADGLNIWDASGQTMIVSFSKQSVRFFQNIVGPVFDTGGALTDTINASTFGVGTDSKESRIQAAISAASLAGITHVYIPAALYPYSAQSISFDTRVQMVREGGEWSVFDIIAYGANGNGSTGSAAGNSNAIQSAISGANADPHNTGLSGGVVFVPPGQYAISTTVNVPAAINQGQVILRGAGMRVSYLVPQTSCVTAVLFGNPVPDPSGTFTNETFYCGLEDLSIQGSLITGAVCAIEFMEMQKGWIRNSIIEKFNQPGAIGLYLRGSTGQAAPHSWRGGFMNLLVATTQRPLVIENGDENDFYNCNFGLQGGLTSAVTALQLTQGRNNRFFGLLLAGESSSLTTGRIGYTGALFGGQAAGDCSGNQIYGAVTEGFDSGISVASNATNIIILFHNPSINRLGLTDAGTGTLYLAPQESAINPLYQWPSGTAIAPAFAFRSDGSLGWYLSATSTMGLTAEGRLVVGSGAAFSLVTQPEYGFGGEPQLGFRRSGASSIDAVAGNLQLARFGASGNAGYVGLAVGSQTTPSIQFSAEPTLGWYRSGTSQMAIAPTGRVVVGSPNAFFLITAPEFCFTDLSTGMSRRATHNMAMVAGGVRSGSFVSNGGLGTFQAEQGSSLTPGIGWANEPGLGFYRSGNSTIGLSYGTFLVNGPLWSSGVSVGPGGTQIPAISSMSSLVGAFIVQGSASSFTGITWAAAKIGDHIITSPFQGGAASSLSSGLVAHSIVTVNGQIEFRLSNVSTLVQNQSSQTWIFTRITAF